MKILNFSSILKLSRRGWYTLEIKNLVIKKMRHLDLIWSTTTYTYLLSYYDDEELQSYILGGPL